MSVRDWVHRSFLGLAGALAIGAMIAGPASAATSNASVTQQITSGSLTASIGSGSMNAVPYSNGPQTTSGSVHLSVADASGTAAGWNVLVSSSAFVYSGSSSIGVDIPATDFSITTDHAPTLVAGQAIDATGGPYAVTATAYTLDTNRKVIGANVGYGSGSYGQDLDLSLAVPAQSQAGTYTATLTVSITTGP